mgnify:CR=1 FL=1
MTLDALRDFARDVKSGKANFTQTVTAPDGKRKKVSSGSFEFERPNRFRFVYAKPFEQTIVADGSKVWIYDADLEMLADRGATVVCSGDRAGDLALSRRRPQAALPHHRLQAPEDRRSRQGRGDRVRPEPHRAHRAAAVR